MPLCLLIYVRCVPSLIFRLLERPSWACKLLSVPSWSAPHNKGGFKGQKVSRLLIVLFDFFFHLISKVRFLQLSPNDLVHDCKSYWPFQIESCPTCLLSVWWNLKELNSSLSLLVLSLPFPSSTILLLHLTWYPLLQMSPILSLESRWPIASEILNENKLCPYFEALEVPESPYQVVTEISICASTF